MATGQVFRRRDAWWVQPVTVFTILTAFIVYATFRVFENQYYVYGPYLSPFGSPDFTSLLPGFIASAIPFPISPALLILPFPAGFRFTCYYYRKSYYRSFAATPAGCAVPGVGAGKRNYQGERKLLLFQNLHRYFLYAAIVIVFILAYDAFLSFIDPVTGAFRWGIGSFILIANVVLLAAYTFGCHSFRHLIGGKLNCFSCDAVSGARYGFWKRVTTLNQRHMLWAWASLFSVVAADLYIRYIASNQITTLLGVPA